MPVYEVDVTYTIKAESPDEAGGIASSLVNVAMIASQAVEDGYVGQIGEV